MNPGPLNGTQMNCTEVEVLLAEYCDDTLDSAQRTLVDAHLASCAACGELRADIAGLQGFLERVPAVDPPPELVTRILHELPANKIGGARPRWITRLLGNWVRPILQPRYAMGMAMTVLSFSMVARFAGLEPRQLKPSDLDPVKIWSSLDNRAHRGWDRAVKYYDNLKLVIELQSRLKELNDQEPDQTKPQTTQRNTKK